LPSITSKRSIILRKKARFSKGGNAMRALNNEELGKVAGGVKNGFDQNSGQGNLNNDNVKDNPGTVTESGPKGVLKNNNTDNPNYDISGPGNSN
jgi:hypothetical protein